MHLYIIVHNVEDIDLGVYYYRRSDHTLTQIRKGDYQSTSYAMSLFQEVVGSSNAAIVMTIDSKIYGRLDADRGVLLCCFRCRNAWGPTLSANYRHWSGVLWIGAFFDDEVSQAIKVDPDKELVIYMASIGTKKE